MAVGSTCNRSAGGLRASTVADPSCWELLSQKLNSASDRAAVLLAVPAPAGWGGGLLSRRPAAGGSCLSTRLHCTVVQPTIALLASHACKRTPCHPCYPTCRRRPTPRARSRGPTPRARTSLLTTPPPTLISCRFICGLTTGGCAVKWQAMARAGVQHVHHSHAATLLQGGQEPRVCAPMGAAAHRRCQGGRQGRD